jgi:hypothetical protein
VKTLAERIGEQILVRSNVLHAEQPQIVTLRGVKFGGIWVESQEMTNDLLARVGAPSSPATPVMFLPFAQILWILASYPGQSLQEKAFGL